MLLGIREGRGIELLALRDLFDLSAQLGHVLELLNSGLVTLHSDLNRLCRSMLALRQFLKPLRVLLFLLKKHLVVMAGLLSLVDQLLDDLFALLQRLLDTVIAGLHS